MFDEMPKHILAEADYVAGMKYKDIAEKYEVSLNTVKSWKSRHGWSKEKGAHKSEKGCAQNMSARVHKEKVIAREVEQVIENPDLTDKQRLFCLYYIRSFNATSSYQKAFDTSYNVANAEGYKLLVKPCVKDEIMRLKKERMNREFLSEEDIFEKYMQIAFADITNYVEFGVREVPVMGAFGPIEVEDEDGEKIKLTKEVNVVRFMESSEVDGTLISEVKQGKDGASIKLPDRMKALEWLSEHMDMATVEQRAKVELLEAQRKKLEEEGFTGEGVVIVNDAPKGD